MRKLTMRERVLLVLLAVVAVISGYVLFFYTPITERTQTLEGQLQQVTETRTQLVQRVENMQRMQRELEQLETAEQVPPMMPEYDNVLRVMVELDRILAGCESYSLSFQEGQTDGKVYYRQVAMPFVCRDYAQAKSVLQQLHDSTLRCMLDSVTVVQQEDGSISGTVTVTFLEYREEGGTAQETEENAAS